MTIKLGINGFGRIGRSILRALTERDLPQMQVVAINDPTPLATSAHLFELDSIHGRFRQAVTLGQNTMDIGTGPIRMSHETAPEKLDWSDVDIVLECSGFFRAPEDAARHLRNGSKRVLISAPANGDLKTIVYGVNHDQIESRDIILSNASCTTNCLVPVAHLLNQTYGITRGHMTTVHSYTGTQTLHDTAHADLYRARAAALSMIPTTTGAAETLGVVLPQLKDRIIGTAIRVPTPNVSCIDLVVETEKPATPEDINALFAEAADGPFEGIIDFTDRKMVSIDFNQDPASAIVAGDQTTVQQGNLMRVLAWYDNEWAFSNRMLDTANRMAQLI
ncbi:Glyceraldehyde-3-phosphate dehydrogenase [Sulfitobacter noctilucicola]|uniref:Glyceraldehyde-3-phosphate dehydrogenase n=1 Tax=Sulfitobacter noctilucicola TaxID=1342301 RepID=A0A7W6MAX6_9RHOB|nr:type I glyceraldehyde-3-phosphate dehydrogenase [Sulfitobacter noctilucicola]KIN66343.1 Glyceraldehyde-3-phosphate dehydrogenase [Sulfitobacter noctilucicola]MBB4175693.1 glyceraldehyde 3-phosphate dehydrogenase [Sulfitobacter noctilucicola]